MLEPVPIPDNATKAARAAGVDPAELVRRCVARAAVPFFGVGVPTAAKSRRMAARRARRSLLAVGVPTAAEGRA